VGGFGGGERRALRGVQRLVVVGGVDKEAGLWGDGVRNGGNVDGRHLHAGELRERGRQRDVLGDGALRYRGHDLGEVLVDVRRVEPLVVGAGAKDVVQAELPECVSESDVVDGAADGVGVVHEVGAVGHPLVRDGGADVLVTREAVARVAQDGAVGEVGEADRVGSEA
jgi:hypothetical protein